MIFLTEPQNIVLYTDMKLGFVAWFDPFIDFHKNKTMYKKYNSTTDMNDFEINELEWSSDDPYFQQVHLIGQSLKPVGVAFDPVVKVIG